MARPRGDDEVNRSAGSGQDTGQGTLADDGARRDGGAELLGDGADGEAGGLDRGDGGALGLVDHVRDRDIGG